MTSKVLCTFSGKFGDILWSLATAKQLSEDYYGAPVDFAIMPQYKSLLEVLEFQPYIAEAKVLPDWECTGSPHGDQPWQPPRHHEEGYEHVHHLTYRSHPGIGGPAMPLVDFIAHQQEIKLRHPVLPFIEAQPIDIFPPPPQPVIPYGFNFDYFEAVQQFKARLILRTSGLLAWVDVSEMPWFQAVSVIAQHGIFVGCRSSLWVIANGVKAKIFTYEPNPARHASGQFGAVFGCPYGSEDTAAKGSTPQQAADEIATKVIAWRDEYWSRERRGERVIA